MFWTGVLVGIAVTFVFSAVVCAIFAMTFGRAASEADQHSEWVFRRLSQVEGESPIDAAA